MHKHIWRQKFALHTFHFSEAIKWNISTQAYRNTYTHTTTPPICRQFALLVATHSRRLYTVGRSPPNTKLTRLACWCSRRSVFVYMCEHSTRDFRAIPSPTPPPPLKMRTAALAGSRLNAGNENVHRKSDHIYNRQYASLCMSEYSIIIYLLEAHGAHTQESSVVCKKRVSVSGHSIGGA